MLIVLNLLSTSVGMRNTKFRVAVPSRVRGKERKTWNPTVTLGVCAVKLLKAASVA